MFLSWICIIFFLLLLVISSLLALFCISQRMPISFELLEIIKVYSRPSRSGNSRKNPRWKQRKKKKCLIYTRLLITPEVKHLLVAIVIWRSHRRGKFLSQNCVQGVPWVSSCELQSNWNESKLLIQILTGIKIHTSVLNIMKSLVIKLLGMISSSVLD